MNLVVDNTAPFKLEANNHISVGTQQDSEAIYIIQITHLEGTDNEVLSRHTFHQFFRKREDAEEKVKEFQRNSDDKLYYIQPVWPYGRAGPKISIVN